ncbi:hypothetical protein VTJ04DRAFT_10323 [Mycothermus thermophilus]|uniref:uncharacterized protein n=1 Tax=Humicola insolens TaxID=85995 RepID=UPI003743AA24
MEKTHAHHHHTSTNTSSQGLSHVGMRSVYEDGNQRAHSQAEVEKLSRETGTNIKGFLPKDQSKKLDKLYLEQVERDREEHAKRDPTYLANLHHAKPSKGAVIDKEIMEEEQEYLRKKKEKEEMSAKKVYE